MKNYRIVVEPPKKGVLLLEDEVPSFDSNEVLIQTIYTGICGTDEEIISGLYGEVPSGKKYLTLGHETIGRVVGVGKEVRDFKEGDLVVPMVRRSCDNCKYCLEDKSDMCYTGNYFERGIKGLNGFMTNYFVESERYLIKVPENLKDLGVLLEPLSIGEKAIKQFFALREGFGLCNDKINALVEGSGPIGLLTSFILRSYNIETHTFDRRSENTLKPEILRNIGAHHINIRDKPIGELVKEDYKFDLIIEATGNSSLTFESLDCLGIDGVFVMTGLPCSNGIYNLNLDKLMKNMVLNNQTLIGIVNSNLSHFKTALSDLQMFNSVFTNDINRVITKVVDLSNYKEAFKERDSDKEIKTVIRFGD
ncbi:MAG: glucose 1-dehydrogenase [Nanoarchaeota archaeon]|nr:glucose 1-dehydrogenase [Nanoarchaeota archaeon]